MSFFSTNDKSEALQQIATIKQIIENKKRELKSPYATPQQKASIRKYIADCKGRMANIKLNMK